MSTFKRVENPPPVTVTELNHKLDEQLKLDLNRLSSREDNANEKNPKQGTEANLKSHSFNRSKSPSIHSSFNSINSQSDAEKSDRDDDTDKPRKGNKLSDLGSDDFGK